MIKFNYKGYNAQFEYCTDEEEPYYFGKISGISDYVIPIAKTEEELKRVFEEGIDEWLEGKGRMGYMITPGVIETKKATSSELMAF